jgi:hypothetical protein
MICPAENGTQSADNFVDLERFTETNEVGATTRHIIASRGQRWETVASENWVSTMKKCFSAEEIANINEEQIGALAESFALKRT